MDAEIYNPTRRFKWFRPRQASRGGKQSGTPTNRATIGLYNNSLGAHMLVVRDWALNTNANANISVAYVNGQVGTSQGNVVSLVPTEASQAGLIASIDTATVYPSDYGIASASLGEAQWPHEFPFAVIPPGWSLVFQHTTNAQALTVVALWESILPDELDFFW